MPDDASFSWPCGCGAKVVAHKMSGVIFRLQIACALHQQKPFWQPGVELAHDHSEHVIYDPFLAMVTESFAKR